jgi:3-deoxy-D-manno-octulosonic acid (KDO) 8-phosphate synthase
MRKQKLCKQCGQPIFNRSKSAKYCKECSSPKMVAKRYSPKYLKYKREWAKKNRKKLNEYAKEAMEKNKEIISLLRRKYSVKTYSDILERLRKEVEE